MQGMWSRRRTQFSPLTPFAASQILNSISLTPDKPAPIWNDYAIYITIKACVNGSEGADC